MQIANTTKLPLGLYSGTWEGSTLKVYTADGTVTVSERTPIGIRGITPVAVTITAEAVTWNY